MDRKKAIKYDKNFHEMNKKFLDVGATYISYLAFDSCGTLIFSKSSNPDWSDEFTTTGLYKQCHLLREADELIKKLESSFTLAWDLYLPQTEEAKFLEEIRKSKNITHGVGFCFRDNLNNRILLNIAGKYADINFGINILKKSKEVYKELCKFILKNSRQ